MRAVGVYNMKGGVGKTTTAVNLSFVAAAEGRRVLLWDLDPQGASSFAFRVRPRVAGFGRNSLESGESLGAAIKETDYNNLDLLPADFSYRKFDRMLDAVGKPGRVMTGLLDALGRDYDTVFLDCPAGFSLVVEGIFDAADAILVPTIPTVLSLRTVARLIKWAQRTESPLNLAAFFSMVDRRKTLHRRACEWSLSHPELFLAGQIPYASVVEQMAVRRAPLGEFAAREPATIAFAEIWTELETRLEQPAEERLSRPHRWTEALQAIESLMGQLESPDGQKARVLNEDPPGGSNGYVAHRFDTERRDLERSGHVLELREEQGSLLVVAGRSGREGGGDVTLRAQAEIDSSWAVQILSGKLSPLSALERRLGRPGPRAVENVRGVVGERTLQRIESRHVAGTGGAGRALAGSTALHAV